MSELNSTMCFGASDRRDELAVLCYSCGTVRVGVVDNYNSGSLDYPLTLQQAIGLRDFLNRHIDCLALGSIGASTERSSDDPAQLPAEHVVGGQVTAAMVAAACDVCIGFSGRHGESNDYLDELAAREVLEAALSV